MPRLIPISTIATQCCPSDFLPLKFLAPPPAAPPFGAFGPGKICCKAWSPWVYIYQYDPMCQQVLMGAELALWFAFVWRWWVMEFDAFLEILMANHSKRAFPLPSAWFMNSWVVKMYATSRQSEYLSSTGLNPLWIVWGNTPPASTIHCTCPLMGTAHHFPPLSALAFVLGTAGLAAVFFWDAWAAATMDRLYPANSSRTIITIGVKHFPLETKGLLIRNCFTWLSEGQYTTYISFLKGHDFLNLQMLTLSLPVNRAF